MTLTEYGDETNYSNGQGNDDEQNGDRVQVTGEVVNCLADHFADFTIAAPESDVA